MGESASISEIDLADEDIFRTIVLRFVKTTRVEPEKRPFNHLFDSADKEFLRDSLVRSVVKMNGFQTCARRIDESIIAFWIRFQQMTNDSESRGITFGPPIVYFRAPQALQLSEKQGCDVIAAMGESVDNRCPLSLRLITTRIFNHPTKVDGAPHPQTMLKMPGEMIPTWMGSRG